MAEVEKLDAEAKELSKVVADPEVQSLLGRLLQITGKSAPQGPHPAA